MFCLYFLHFRCVNSDVFPNSSYLFYSLLSLSLSLSLSPSLSLSSPSSVWFCMSSVRTSFPRAVSLLVLFHLKRVCRFVFLFLFFIFYLTVSVCLSWGKLSLQGIQVVIPEKSRQLHSRSRDSGGMVYLMERPTGRPRAILTQVRFPGCDKAFFLFFLLLAVSFQCSSLC